MPKPSLPQHPLERAVRAGDPEAVVSVLHDLGAEQRAAQRPLALRLAKLVYDAESPQQARAIAAWGGIGTPEQRSAALIAVVACGTAEDVARFHRYDTFNLRRAAREFRPPSLEGLGDALMLANPQNIHPVQTLIVDGLIARPMTDAYALGIMNLRPRKRPNDVVLSAEAWLQTDPGFAAAMLRILEVEGFDKVNLTAVDRSLFSNDGQQWSAFLPELVERGVYSRSLILEKLLAALSRGWTPFRSQWFSALHETLAFTAGERMPHAASYLALVGSDASATISLALESLRQIDGRQPFAASAIFEAFTKVFRSGVRAHIEAALTLVDASVEREPAVAGAAAACIAPALAHERADVQEQILDRLAKWPLNDAVRAVIAGYVASVSATQRPRLQALLGGAETAEQAATPGQRYVSRGPLDPALYIAPIESLEELTERGAYAMAQATDIDEFERVLAALVRMAPYDHNAQWRLGRLRRPVSQALMAVNMELNVVLHYFVSRERTGFPDSSGAASFEYLNESHQQLCLRCDELMTLTERSPGCQPLATPTHWRGFIDPAALVERLARYRERRVQPGPLDAMLAILRLAPVAAEQTLAAARALGDDMFARAIRYALGEDLVVSDPELQAAATRIRAMHVADVPRPVYQYRLVRDEDALWRLEIDVSGTEPHLDPVTATERRFIRSGGEATPYSNQKIGGHDASSIAYYATWLPADPDGFFAMGALALANNLRSTLKHGHNLRYLERLLHPAARQTPMATLLLALGFAVRQSGFAPIAVEALVQANAAGFIDAGQLGRDICRLTAEDFAPVGPFAKGLRAAYAQDGSTGPAIFEVLVAALEARPQDPPRDTAALLELMLEISLGHDLRVPPERRAVLAQLAVAGKGDTLRKKLLARGT